MAPQSPESRLARIEEMSARLDERTASLIREVERLARDVETTAVESGQVIEVLAEVRAVTEDFNKLRAELDAERVADRGGVRGGGVLAAFVDADGGADADGAAVHRGGAYDDAAAGFDPRTTKGASSRRQQSHRVTPRRVVPR
jgi:hypothetical protein